MRAVVFFVLALALGAVGLDGAVAAADPTGQPTGQPAGQLVSEVAAAGTPHVLDGRVYSVAQVGNTIILGGSFTQARNDSGDTSTLARANLLAFDATTGKISTTFEPNPNDEVRDVVPTGDGTSVYVGGAFTTINGVARQRVARIRVSDGAVISTFNAGAVTGEVKDMALRDGRLWIAGAFTNVGGRSQGQLATLDPTTGAGTKFMGLAIAGVNNSGVTQVMKFDISPDGTQVAAIGNFDTLAGVQNHQLFTLDIGGALAAPGPLRTSFYSPGCSKSFDSYMRDVSYAPDGSYFVVGTTGAYGGAGSPCDSVARFEASASGTQVVPSWIDNSGGDTTYTVQATASAIYVGGHERWWNNPFAGDKAGPGAVSREGLAALDPTNGLPLTWNPTRDKGVGVFDFRLTSQGLWIASDTDRIGQGYQYKGRIALMPPGGASFPAVHTPALPDDVYLGGPMGLAVVSNSADLLRRSYDGTVAGTLSPAPDGRLDWDDVQGAFMINGSLYLAHADGSFDAQTFDGTSYGAPVAIDTASQIVPLTSWRSDVAASTGMFFDDGRIYFTLGGSRQLYYRYFSPQSGVVGAQRFVAADGSPGIDFSSVRGLFLSGQQLYWATAGGDLHEAGWTPGAVSGAPAAASAHVVSGPAVDGAAWSAHALFLYQGADGGPATAPTASFSQACSSLTCAFDASGSTSSGAGIVSYAWQFGDGTTGAGSAPTHTFAAPGTYTATLTVTTGTGASNTTSHPVSVITAPAPTLAFVVGAGADANASSFRVTIPASVQEGDQLILLSSYNSSGVTVTGPAGWTPLDAVAVDGVLGRSWTRTATAADAGSTLVVTSSAVAKADLAVYAYRGSGGPGGAAVVVGHAASVDSVSGRSHTGPVVPVPSGSWVLASWSAKTSVDQTWTLPSAMASRTSMTGTGGGHLTEIGADSGGPAAAGSTGAYTAVGSQPSTRTVMFTVAVGLD